MATVQTLTDIDIPVSIFSIPLPKLAADSESHCSSQRNLMKNSSVQHSALKCTFFYQLSNNKCVCGNCHNDKCAVHLCIKYYRLLERVVKMHYREQNLISQQKLYHSSKITITFAWKSFTPASKSKEADLCRGNLFLTL